MVNDDLHRSIRQPLLYMVTTTSVPYMYHVPIILGIPTGVPYWFRYLSRYIHPDLMKLPKERIPKHGILYLRDNGSAQKLCFPIRYFKVLWFERSETVSFLNLLMAPRVPYSSAPVPADKHSPAPAGVNETSWRLLAEHVRDYREKPQGELVPLKHSLEPCPVGVAPEVWSAFLAYEAGNRADSKRPAPRTVAAPSATSPPIVPWDELKAADDALLWVTEGVPLAAQPDSLGLFAKIRALWRVKVDDELARWRSMLPAFAAMEHVNKTPFFFMRAPTSISAEKSAAPSEIGGGGGLYSHGFPCRPAETYRLRVDEITPYAFCDDAPTSPPFKLTIEKSDPAIRPTVKEVQIDGPYGHYEFSFDLDPGRVGTYALLRVSTDGLALPASDDAAAGSLAMPDMVVPLNIRRRWVHDLFWAVASFVFIIAFVSAAQWMPHYGIEPKSAGGTLVQALLFGLAIFFAKKAGVGDLASSVGGKM